MYVRPVAVAALASAGILLSAGVASAAAPAAVKSPPVKNTTQKISYHAVKHGGYKYSEEITFAAKTFSIAAFGDTGTFKVKAGTLTLTVVTSASGQDTGCVFTGSYDATNTVYAGAYTCPGGYTNSFVVTTTGT